MGAAQGVSLPAAEVCGVYLSVFDSHGSGEADEENRRNDRHEASPEKTPPYQKTSVKL